MNDPDWHFHQTWLGMVQPAEGLVVSVPILVQAQCAERQPADRQRRLADCVANGNDGIARVADVGRLLAEVLGYPEQARSTSISPELELYVPEGRQILRPSIVLSDPTTPRPLVLVWELPNTLDLDTPETVTGPWNYPPTIKFDRLLRHTGVPIGLLCNGCEFRLLYAPAGEATGTITFRLADMLTSSGRPVFDAFLMLLSAHRVYAVAAERSLQRILEDSRKWQATVSGRLADQVFEAADILLRGFEEAGLRQGRTPLSQAMEHGGDFVHRGILTALLRIVFLRYAEDSALVPIENPLYRDGLSVSGLHDELREDASAYPDQMPHRFGAWNRLLSAFRAILLGITVADLVLPARRGTLFDTHRFPFLEGWMHGGSAPIHDARQRGNVSVPTISDGTVLAVLDRLLVLDGQRISYRSLDVEQIGSVYESMLGYAVERLQSTAVCVRGSRRWVGVDEALATSPARRAKWLKDELGAPSGSVERAAKSLGRAKNAPEMLEVLRSMADKGADGQPLVRRIGSLVIQPRRSLDTTTTHYTPRELCRPLVRRVLDPVLAALGPTPSVRQILSLKVCDPAMGSGAFLVEACRYLAEHLLAAWQREGMPSGVLEPVQDPLIAARRVVAQRCLYGVDRNADAVELAKLSLWLVTLARELPFTFVDHALRHGDSLVGLDREQIASFHWDPHGADAVLQNELRAGLAEALPTRTRLEELASESSTAAQTEKQKLLWDADDALLRLRTIGDLILAAYFFGSSRVGREANLRRYRDAAERWLHGDEKLPQDIDDELTRFRSEVSPFHWAIEFPEVFDAARPDPLEPESGPRLAQMDAFAGNMPFIGGRRIASVLGERYAEWLCHAYNSTGDVDYVTYFFLRAHQMLGDSGTVGFIATNSISQGDTRRTGLQRLLSQGLTIYDAQNRLPWPGDANVLVAPILLAKGSSRKWAVPYRLNGQEVPIINSRLRAYAERADPRPLQVNDDIAFVGCFLRGEGFVLSPEQAQAILRAAPTESEIIRPFLVGQDIARDPNQLASRFVVDFGLRELEQARAFPRAMGIVEERVRPEREELRSTGGDAAHRRYWWRFANPRTDLRKWLAENDACLVLPRVAKHLMVARVPTAQVFSEQVVVFAVDTMTAFASLQSRVHEIWVRLLSSTMGEGLRYSATDCLVNFPFPGNDPRARIAALESIGEKLHVARHAYMAAENIGLTTLYNRLHDSELSGNELDALRRMHCALDRAVVAAYAAIDPDGKWNLIEVPPFAIDAGVDHDAAESREKFEDAVIDRLFQLNERRASNESTAATAPPRKLRKARVTEPAVPVGPALRRRKAR